MTRLSARPLTDSEKDSLILESFKTYTPMRPEMACFEVEEAEPLTWFDRLIDWLNVIPEHYVWRACFGISMLVVLALLATVVWSGVL